MTVNFAVTGTDEEFARAVKEGTVPSDTMLLHDSSDASMEPGSECVLWLVGSWGGNVMNQNLVEYGLLCDWSVRVENVVGEKVEETSESS